MTPTEILDLHDRLRGLASLLRGRGGQVAGSKNGRVQDAIRNAIAPETVAELIAQVERACGVLALQGVVLKQLPLEPAQEPAPSTDYREDSVGS